MKHNGTTSAEGGFTLVELLVSLVVGSILVGSVHIVYTNQLSLSQNTRDTVIANSFAESKMEALRSKGYLGLGTGNTDITGELPGELQSPRSASLEVTQQTTSVKKVLLTLSYKNQGTTQTYAYTTYLGELGAGQY